MKYASGETPNVGDSVVWRDGEAGLFHVALIDAEGRVVCNAESQASTIDIWPEYLNLVSRLTKLQ